MYNSEEEEEYISIFDNSNNIHEITLNENLFMNYLLKIKYTMSLKDYIDEEDDDSDCLQQGMKYNLTMECRKDDMISLKRNHIVFSNKKMSVDSYNY